MSGKLSFAMPGSKAGANAKLAATKGKKTPFQQAKEATEAKKALEKAEADSLLGEFEKSFSADTGSNGSKAFVPSGGGSIYQPAAKPLSEMERMMLESAQAETRGRGAADARAPSTLSELSAVRSQKRREMDAFLEEIKQRQDGGGPLASMSLAEAAAAGNAAGRNSSQDEGDPSSTNLYIGHVAPTVTEERLQTLFGEFGEIYSIKIMWPRTDEERARQRNCGFVSFWRRGDAEAAKQALQSRELDGMCIQIGWGKAINKLAHGIGDETRVKDVPLNALSAALSDPAAASAADAITVLAPVKDSAAEDPANMVNALLASAGLASTVPESTARAVAEAALVVMQKTRAAQAAALAAAPQPLASDAPPPEMQEGDPSVTVVEPHSEERRYLIDRTAR
jgi:RNA recognition motif. (a.k.a. RRM, RBD, or RNP domain)